MRTLTPQTLAGVGRILLLASFGYALLLSIRGKQDSALPFERLVIGFVALLFFENFSYGLEQLSALLSDFVRGPEGRDLKAVVLGAFKRAAESGGVRGGVNIPSLLEQAWRTGIWGIMAAFVEGVFLIVEFVLDCAREVLWTLLLLLTPLACGVFPVFPRILSNLALYAVELSLWSPLLNLVERVGGGVAQGRAVQDGSWGLYLVGVEAVAIVLICLIPTVAHRFLSGAFSGDFGSQQTVLVLVQKVVRMGPAGKARVSQ